jgi:hypothetical protein
MQFSRLQLDRLPPLLLPRPPLPPPLPLHLHVVSRQAQPRPLLLQQLLEQRLRPSVALLLRLARLQAWPSLPSSARLHRPPRQLVPQQRLLLAMVLPIRRFLLLLLARQHMLRS